MQADEPQVGQRPEDVERKLEYYGFIIFPERNFTSKKKRKSEHHGDGTLQKHRDYWRVYVK